MQKYIIVIAKEPIMAKDEATLLDLVGGSNLTKIKKDAHAIWQKYQKKEAELLAINEQLASHRADLVSMGIPRSSFSEVKRRAKLDADQRRAHDFGVQVFSDAIGYQIDLFESADDRSDANPKSEPREHSSLLPTEEQTAEASGEWPDDKQTKGRKRKAKEVADKYIEDSRSLEGLSDEIAKAEGKLNEADRHHILCSGRWPGRTPKESK